MPAGRLREFPSAASRADIVLLTNGDDTSPLDARTFRVRRRILGCFGSDGAARPAPARAFLLAGIARPERFEADVRSTGADVVGRRFFPDHHAFTPREAGAAADAARLAEADALVTTAKDAVRLPEVPFPLLVFRIAAEIGDEERFRERLLAVARLGRA